MTRGGYPDYEINRDTVYRVPPGWTTLVSGLLHELDEMRTKGILGKNFQVTQVFASSDGLAMALAGRFRPEDVSGLLRAYAERSRKVCAECGYEGAGLGLRRPACRACATAKKGRMQ
jgi:hypothetical protein